MVLACLPVCHIAALSPVSYTHITIGARPTANRVTPVRPVSVKVVALPQLPLGGPSETVVKHALFSSDQGITGGHHCVWLQRRASIDSAATSKSAPGGLGQPQLSQPPYSQPNLGLPTVTSMGSAGFNAFLQLQREYPHLEPQQIESIISSAVNTVSPVLQLRDLLPEAFTASAISTLPQAVSVDGAICVISPVSCIADGPDACVHPAEPPLRWGQPPRLWLSRLARQPVAPGPQRPGQPGLRQARRQRRLRPHSGICVTHALPQGTPAEPRASTPD